MHNYRIGMAIVAAIGLSVSFVAAEKREHPTQPFMRQKLNYSQGILEGLTLEKYDLIVSNATLLRDMNLTNIFLRVRFPDFIQSISNFQSKVDGLISAAKAN